MQQHIMLNESAIEYVIKLSNYNPEVISYFEGKLSKQRNKRKRQEEKKFISSQSKKKKLLEVSNNFRNDLIKKQTTQEMKFKVYLKDLNINYEFQKIIYTDTSFYIVDFYLPKYHYVIEIDGGYHENRDQKRADKRRTIVLKDAGIKKIIRFKNSVIDRTSYCIDRMKKDLKI